MHHKHSGQPVRQVTNNRLTAIPHSGQPVRHLTHRRLTAIFFYLAILISVMISLPIMITPRQGLADANPELKKIDPAAQVSAGMAHSLFLDYDGLVYAWGDNTYGQIGAEGEDHANTAVQLELPEPAREISAGAFHSLILGESGAVYALGRNAFGQVGDGTVDNVDTPVKITGLPTISAIAAGAYHSLALGEDGSVWVWGDNTHGQVGDVHSEEVLGLDNSVLALRNTRPVEIVKSGAVAIAAGGNFSIYLDQSEHMYSWGENNQGQLGDGTTESHATPSLVPGISQVVQVAVGSNHVLALSTASGYRQLYVWGDNSLGQLGLGGQKVTTQRQLQPTLLDLTGNLDPSDERILSVVAGYAQSAVIRDVSTSRFSQPFLQNELYVWGHNASSQLDLEDKTSRYEPVRLQGSYDGYWGSRFLPFESMAFGSDHMLLLSSKGLLAAVGDNSRGQLGLKDETMRSQLTMVKTHDLFLPAWSTGQTLQINTQKDGAIQIKWPQAQDNTAVAGYYVTVNPAGQAPIQEDVGLTTVWEISSIDPAIPVQISVQAYDANSQEDSLSELARLTGYRLPENTDPENYFLQQELFKNPDDLVTHNWTPTSVGHRRPHEVPWSLTAIENLQKIPNPYLPWMTGAGCLLVAIVIVWLIYRRLKGRRSVVKVDSESKIEAG